MNGALAAGCAVLGALVAGAALRDVFRTLWHPSGEGRLTRWVSRVVWRCARRCGGAVLDVAGPLVMVAVIVAWVGLVVLGFALVHLGWLGRDGYAYDAGLDADAGAPVVDALYLSAVVLSTLGFGDIVPTDGWLRLLTAGEALIGFTLLTAVITWVTQVQQALARRRSCARFLVALRRTDRERVAVVPGYGLLEQVARDLAGVQVDLQHSTTSYYFRERDPHASLAVALEGAAELAERGSHAPDPAVQGAAALLGTVVDDLCVALGTTFLRPHGTEREDVVAAYLADHRQDGL
ncbi:potassium channel family protein [Cellulomonas phragmiteti]|uniref:Potassium channel domain-containing protein n=1 Tax=Cellulomonas phragmiteti TaxID=478780 RepID=A0ABQ4DP24_9CELL|nr:potassium channel family protein [Cellulomonas phragmiteti]GIG41088.1 hypothetical protein Cph01nite_28500 [Cellulomonas phragmiteti]